MHEAVRVIVGRRAVDDFRAGKTWALIGTEVIARGMDFKGVNCVINYDFPDSDEEERAFPKAIYIYLSTLIEGNKDH
ncbi:hypothetical protein WN943_003746 [Citrus x changshan-huyou]